MRNANRNFDAQHKRLAQSIEAVLLGDDPLDADIKSLRRDLRALAKGTLDGAIHTV